MVDPVQGSQPSTGVTPGTEADKTKPTSGKEVKGDDNANALMKDPEFVKALNMSIVQNICKKMEDAEKARKKARKEAERVG